MPGYGLFTTADGGQVALGVLNEQHFWSSLCDELGLDGVADLGFDERGRRGAELQGVIGAAIATKERDALVARLAAAGVPVAPVLDRTEMLAGAPFPAFPIRLPLPETLRAVPTPTNTVVRASVGRAEGRRPARAVTVQRRMTRISELLSANQAYAAARANVADPRPGRHLAVVTCMDARIDVFAVLGLHLGEAHVIRNAGGRVTDDVLRSLALSSGVLGVDTALVMQHTKCGLAGVSDAQLRELTGADLGFFPIDDHAAALREDVDLLARTPYLNRLRTIAGFVYDVETGELEDVVHWDRPG